MDFYFHQNIEEIIKKQIDEDTNSNRIVNYVINYLDLGPS